MQAYDAGEHEGMHYLVMEYVEGKDLAAVLTDRGPLPVALAVECIVQAARGLQYAHEHGIVHRDIKPGNLLLDRQGTVKILDMGLARLETQNDQDEAERLTADGQVMGTWDYMAPEQALDTHTADARADVYSLGCTLYRLLTGKLPYHGETPGAVLVGHREAPIPSLRTLRADVPPNLDAAFRRMLAKRPEDRFQTMAEVIAALEACQGSRPGVAQALAEASSSGDDPGDQEGLSFLDRAARGDNSLDETRTYHPRQKTATSLGPLDRLLLAVGKRKPIAALAVLAALALVAAGLMLNSEFGSRNSEGNPETGMQAVGRAERSEARQKEKPETGTRKPEVVTNPEPSPPLARSGRGAGVEGSKKSESHSPNSEFRTPNSELPNTPIPNPQSPIATSAKPETGTRKPEGETNSKPPAPAESQAASVPSPLLGPDGNWSLPPGAPSPAVAPFDSKRAKEHQEYWANYLGVPVEWTNAIGIKFVFIPPGEFDMGSTPEEQAWAMEAGRGGSDEEAYATRVSSEGPRHRVKITRPFYLGMYPVTQGEYEKVMGVNPSAFTEKQMEASSFQPPFSTTDVRNRLASGKRVRDKDTRRHPVETVSWNDATDFCRRISAMPAERVGGTGSASETRSAYRLPTEAEWEYACRAGTTTRWYHGDNEARLVEVAWFNKNADSMTHPVGEKKPNGWGLYDMHGNVYEWCVDWFGADYYRQSPPDNPNGPLAGSSRVLRGGPWSETPSNCRSAYRRSHFAPASRHAYFGFRVAAEVVSNSELGSRKSDAKPETEMRKPAVVTAPEPSPPLARSGRGAGAEGSKNSELRIPNSELSSPQSPIPSASPSRAVPAERDLASARKAAEDLHKKELAGADTPALKVALAKKFAAQAGQMASDPPGRFTMLRMAYDLAVAAGDAGAALEAVDQLGEAFDVDRFGMKIEVLTGLVKQVRTPADRKALADKALTVLQEAIEHGQQPAAHELLKLLTAESNKIRSKDLLQQIRKARQDLQELAEGAEALRKAQATLAEKPKDPQANLTVGRHVCFVQSDWPRGLAMLAQGGDDALALLARQEINSPPKDADGQVKLADAWWDLSEAQRGRAKENAQRHAGQWYLMAAPHTSGLVKKKIDQRLNEVRKLRLKLSAPPPAKAPFDAQKARWYQQQWAAYLGLPVEITNSIGMKLVLIPPGEFMMGSTEEEQAWATEAGKTMDDSKRGALGRISSEGPRHVAGIRTPFYLAIYHVTQGQYETVIGVNPSARTAKGNRKDAAAFKPPLSAWEAKARQTLSEQSTEDTSWYPVETVNWEDAKEFCGRLSALRTERAARRTYRLPSEAEWEYACRAGTTTRWYCGDDEAGLLQCAWFDQNSRNWSRPVGQLRPNGWGLYDMHGNVSQWCSDWYGEEYYRQSPPNDPAGPPAGSGHVVRGGYASFSACVCRSAVRSHLGPSRSYMVGFRVALTIEP